MQEEVGHLGGCLCGAVRYRVPRHFGNAYQCHCRFCQAPTGTPYLVEHCFSRDGLEFLSGAPRRYTHCSDGSGYEVYVRFCAKCGSKLYLTLERWPDALNIFTGTLDDPSEVLFGPRNYRYLFLRSAQSGTVIPAGYQTYQGHCDPADGRAAEEEVFLETRVINQPSRGSGPHTGGRLCGAVRYQAASDPEWIVMCHCRFCQRAFGGGMNVECLFDKSGFNVTRGDPSAYRHVSLGSGNHVEVAFCGACGGSLWLTGEGFAEVAVLRGTLDEPNRVQPTPANAIQIFLDDAMPCAMVSAGVECFGQHRHGPDGTVARGVFPERPTHVGATSDAAEITAAAAPRG